MVHLGDLIAISNYVTMALLMAVGMYACVRLWRQASLKTESRHLLVGIFFLCFWGVFDQLYRVVLRYLFLHNDPRIELLTDNGWVQVVLYLSGFTGAIYVANALFRSRCLLVAISKDITPRMEGWTIWALLIAAMWVVVFVLTKSLVG